MPKCSHCSHSEFLAERLDAWQAASAALKSTKWPPDYQVDPQDVLFLAMFLAGDPFPGATVSE